jgi:hypothetical protein
VADSGLSLRLLRPDVRAVWNSDLPNSLNDGPLWAGRGLSSSVTLGAGVSYASRVFGVTIVGAPTFLYSANRPFDIFSGTAPGRSFYSSPWHVDSIYGSADLPLRFGNKPLRAIDPGESSVSIRAFNVEGGVTAASAWWGPAIRNALVLGNNAGGIPRAFLKTARPIETSLGRFAAEVTVGTLTESLFFDTISTNDFRTFSGIRLEYQPPNTQNLTLGLARAVYTPQTGDTPRAADAFNALRWQPSALGNDSLRADQIASLFARWVFPESGLEVYGEYARTQMPRSLADLIQTPNNTGGFTLGFQWALARDSAMTWRIQTEVSSLDQNRVGGSRQPVDFYTGRVAAQGYTQRGQIIGAGIGPGGSSEFLAVDRVVRRWQVGVFAGRTRWEANALDRGQFSTFFGQDVTIYSGIRGAVRLPLTDASFEASVSHRQNYLFQNGNSNPLKLGTVNVQNITLTTRLSPR